MADLNKIKRMSLLVQLAQNNEDDRSKHLAQARAAMDDAKEQLANLQEYRANYLESLRGKMSGASNPYNLTSYQQFVSQLADAISQQERVVEQCQVFFEKIKSLWVHAREKRLSLERLRDEAKRQYEQQRDKKEEARILDDFVANKYR
jgi:flagellar export protein FliJ